MPLPADPLLGQQWHLGNSVAGLLDLNVRSVWNPAQGTAYTGADVICSVMDDGFDYNHVDINANYDQLFDYDYLGDDNDPFGNSDDFHGTNCMGIIGAASNGTGAVGIAFDATLRGYRNTNQLNDTWLGDIANSFADISSLTGFLANDVVSCSQAISNDEESVFRIGYASSSFTQVFASISNAVTFGRNGLGMTIVKSAGNARADNYDINADDWTNDTRQVVVAAVNQNGFVSSYSSYGAPLLVSAFGTPGEVVTTDRTGAAGSNTTDYVTNFSGTSAATPMVAGVVALMYDANDGLGWRDVQSILADSARHAGTAFGGILSGAERYEWQWNDAANWNGGGRHFSNDYGYGLVDARAAVRLAETWHLTGVSAQQQSNEQSVAMDMLNSTQTISDNTTVSYFGNTASAMQVERVTVQLGFNTTHTADVDVFVIGPDGTRSELSDDVGGGSDFGGLYTFETQAFRGERASGTWEVQITDDANGDVLQMHEVLVTVFGAGGASEDRYVYTDEYGLYAGIGNHSTFLTDTDGGFNDTINAAAVTTNSQIYLTPGSSGQIANRQLAIPIGTLIEHAIGGDGNDEIIGNDGSNKLYGMRGSDTLKGEANTDLLFGGAGDDRIYDGGGTDVIDGELGQDIVFLSADGANDQMTNNGAFAEIDMLDLAAATSATATVFNGNSHGNVSGGGLGTNTFSGFQRIFGSAFADTVTGAATVQGFGAGLTLELRGGNDVANSGAGDDFVYGMTGNDTLRGGSGVDYIAGMEDNDVLYADADGNGSPSDVFNGGDGAADVLDLFYATSGVTLNYQTGALPYTGSATGGGLGNDIFLGIERIYGSLFGDAVTGLAAIDYFIGRGGNDALNSGGGADTIFGDAGNDAIRGGGGSDIMNGGTEDDTFFADADGVSDTVAGDAGTADVLDLSSATSATTVTFGATAFAGTASGGGLGTDSFTGIERVYGSAFADTVTGGAGGEYFNTRAGADTVYAGTGGDTVYGDAGADRLYGGADGDTIHGGLDSDIWLGGDAGLDYITGGDGADRIDGGADNDTWLGGDAGLDTITGGLGNDRIDGGADNDTWLGGDAGFDTITGGLGNDRIDGGADGDTWLGGDAGIDYITGNTGNDRIDGGADGDSLYGDAGLDTITGGLGFDTINGGADADYIEGGANNDTLAGGAGLDTFDFNPGTGLDSVTDFVNDVDTIRIDPAFGFANVAAVLARAIQSGNHARILLNAAGTDSVYLLNYLSPGNGNTIANLADDILIA